MRFTLSLPSLKLNNPSSVSLSSYIRSSQSLIILVALCWIHSHMSMSLLYWGAQIRAQHHRYDILREGLREKLISLNLLVMFLITGGCWLLLLQRCTAGDFWRCRAHFQHVGPKHVLVHEIPQVLESLFPFVELVEVTYWLNSSAWQSLPEGSTTFWSISHSSSFCIFCKFAEGALCSAV